MKRDQPKISRIPMLGLLSLLFLCACSSVQTLPWEVFLEDPKVLFQQICQMGDSIQKATGQVRIKIHSPKLSTTFSAEAVATQNSEVHLTILDIFGGPQTSIWINPHHYLIQDLIQKEERIEKESEDWNSLPLAWSIDLFLGKIPCPENHSSLSISVTKNQLIVASKNPISSEWIYTLQWLKQGDQKTLIPQSLRWTQATHAPLQKKEVEVQFESFETSTFSYKKWKAHSSQESIECRWQERNITLFRTEKPATHLPKKLQ
jgi:hypothetical protein